LIDQVPPRGHQHDLAFGFLILIHLAGNVMPQQRVSRIDGDFSAGFPRNGLLHRLLIHLRQAKVLDKHRSRRQCKCHPATCKTPLAHQIFCRLDKELHAGVGVVPHVRRNIGRSGRNQLPLLAGRGNLRQPQAVGAKVHANRT
jgi:hypothetical protein